MLGTTLLVCLICASLVTPNVAIAQQSERHTRYEETEHHHGEMSPELVELNRKYDAAWDEWRAKFFDLEIEPGMVVADIGAGKGELTMLLAEKVGAGGVVYANEIVAAKLEGINRRAAEVGLRNVVPVLGTEDDPLLPPGQVDLAIMVEVFHHVSNKTAFLENTRRRIKAGGRLVIIEGDINQEGGNPDGCYSDADETRRLLEEAGFRSVQLRTRSVTDFRFIILSARSPVQAGS